jgi:LCP family protein required for cell wall assembly
MAARNQSFSPRKIVFLAVSAAAAVACLALVLFAIRVAYFIHSVAPSVGFKDLVALVQLNEPFTAAAAPTPHLGRVNFLLLGYGGEGHDGPYLTDSMMVVSAQTDTHQLAMISIPRDTWIAIPTNNRGLNWTTKINAAYTVGFRDDLFPYKEARFKGALGGGNLSSEMVHRLTGLPIQYWVALDFDGFERIVDAVGGVDIDVPRALDDREFPQGETNGVMHVHFNAGRQHMNGERALQFVRLRHTEGGDFDRSRRQQLVLLAVRRKVLSAGGIPKMLGLMSALEGHFRTNMNLEQIRELSDALSRLQDLRSNRISIDDSNFLYNAVSSDGQDILLPYDPKYGGLHQYLEQVFPDPEILVEAAQVQFLNGTYRHSGPRSNADLMAELMSWVGFKTLPVGEAARHDYARSEIHDYSNGTNSMTVDYLARFFNAVVVKEADGPKDGPSVVVIIGRDFADSFLSGRSSR